MSRADYATAPHDPITANDFQVRSYTVDTTHKAHALPAAWVVGKNGQYVALTSTVDAVFAFSLSSSAEVDRGVAPTDAGASLKVGGVLVANQTRYVWLPPVSHGNTLYFVRESASSGAITVEKATD
jgi:hypothetical protein